MKNRLTKLIALSVIFCLCIWVVKTQLNTDFAPNRTSKDNNSTVKFSKTKKIIAAKGKGKEVFSKRTASSKTYALPNKQYRSRIYNAPVHYLEDGQWNSIDLTITSSADKNYQYENTTNTIQSFFPERLSKNNRVKLQNNQNFYHLGNSFLFSLEEDPTTGSKQAEYSVNLNGVKPQLIAENSIKYDNENALGYVSYEVGYNNFKQKFILKELPKKVYDASEKYFTMSETIELSQGWKIVADGKTVEGNTSTKSQLVIKNAGNEVAFIIPLPEIYEEENPQNMLHPSGEMEHSFTVTKKGDSYDIKVAIPREWLTAEDRVFPVVIDPTSNINGGWGGWQNDSGSYVEGNPTSFVFTGVLGAALDYRSWTQFDVSAITDGAMVNSIELEMHMNGTGNAGITETILVNDVTGALGPYSAYNACAYTDFGDGNYTSFTAAAAGNYSNIMLGVTANDDLESRLKGDIYQISWNIIGASTWKRFSSGLNNIEVIWEPVLSITSTEDNITNASSWPMTVTFPEAVTGFVEGDMVITNGAVSDFTTSDNTVFTFTLTAIAEGDVTVDIPAAIATGNVSMDPNKAALQFKGKYGVTVPLFSSSVPLDNATSVSVTDNITITFNEDIAFGTGSIQVIDVSDGSNSFTIDVSSSCTEASISGAVLTINPSANLDDSSNYAIQIAATAIDDTAGNSFAGITDNTTLDFTTVDETNPTLTSSSPTDGASGVTSNGNIVLTFNENIAFGTGNIQVIDVTDGSNSFTIDATAPGAEASINGAVLTINPSADLDGLSNYSIQIAATAIDDASGNSFAGITNNTTLDFTTANNIPSISFTSASSNVSEGNVSGGAGTAFDLDVDLSAASSSTVTVNYSATLSGTPVAGGVLSYAPGEISKSIAIGPLPADDILKINETVIVTLSNPTNSVLGSNSVHTTTIIDDDTAAVTIESVSANENDGVITVTATLDKAVDGGFTVDVSTADGTATTADSDYTAVTSQTLTFAGAAGETQTFTITPTADTKVEADETLTINMNNLGNTTFTTTEINISSVATFIIKNDDSASVTMLDVSGNEDDGAIIVTATLDNPVQGGFSVDVSTVDGTATTADNDYTAVTSQTLTFAGTVGETQTFTVTPTVDTMYEPNETLTITQSNLAATTLAIVITDDATVTINDDDIIPATITFADINKTYGDANFNLGATTNSLGAISYSVIGTANGTSLSGTNNATVSLGNTGAVAIRATLPANGAYSSATKDITLTIDKATLTATADDKSRDYGDANPAFTIEYTGFKNSDTAVDLDTAPTVSSTATTTTNVGTVDITVTGGSDSNYTIATSKGTLTIGKATLLVTALNTTVEYGDNFTIDFEYGAFKNGETAAVLDTGAYVYIVGSAPYNVGTYTIVPDAVNDNNYTPSYVNGTLTVNKATVTATADDQTKVFGKENPIFTISYTGFKGADGAADLDTAPVASSTATTSTPAGNVNIDLSTGTDANYTINSVDGTLAILADTDGDGDPDITDTDDDNDGVLDVDDNSYLPNPDQLDTDGDGLADVEEDCDNDGIVNYYDTDVASCQEGIVMKKKYGFSPNGDGVNDTWVVENIQLFPNNVVHIYNRSGKVVFTMQGYDNSFEGTFSGKKLPVGAYYFTVEFNTPGAKPAKGWIYINY